MKAKKQANNATKKANNSIESTQKTPFKPKEYIDAHPYNRNVVDEVKKEIVDYINSHYKENKIPVYSDWYIGISKDPDNDRTSDHKTEKNLNKLEDYKKFWAKSLANARQVESELCTELEMNHCKSLGGVTAESRWNYVYNLKKSQQTKSKKSK
ncbi:MAG: hypothetical protein JNL70_12255 [Saprospiraceae bacterium]|nr:hypothetical protein [Saprospiraceae bacterium]